MEDYTEEVRRFRESTSSGPLAVIPATVKTESLYPELKEIVWQRFNIPYHRGLELLIHKGPVYFKPHLLRQILLFDIKANLHNKHLGRIATRKKEELNSLSPKQ